MDSNCGNVESHIAEFGVTANPVAEGAADIGKCPPDDGGCPATVGNPINPGNGNKYQREVSYAGTGAFPLEFAWTYNSLNDTVHIPATRSSGLSNWRHSLERSVLVDATSGDAAVFRPDNKIILFGFNGTSWVPNAFITDRLDSVTGGWRYTTADGDLVELYDSAGKLLSITNRTGLTQTLAYSDASTPASIAPVPGLVIRVTDTFGRQLNFTYDAFGHVRTMTDPAGGTYTYAYDGFPSLASVTYPDVQAPARFIQNYLYEFPQVPGTLTGIMDENGQRFATWTYDVFGRPVSSQHGGGAELVTVSYGTNSASIVFNVDAGVSAARTYNFQTLFGVARNTGIAGSDCPSCGPKAKQYDLNGFISQKTDWNDVVTTYQRNDPYGRYDLQTQRTEAVGTPAQRTITTDWHAAFRLQTRVAEPLRITTYVYNGDGGASCGTKADGVTLVPGVLCSKTIQATTDATGAAGFGATPTGAPRTWTYIYNANGSVLTADGPRTDVADVTTYTYYANDDPDPGKRGNVATITNALGHTTSITAYNAHGQPTTIADPNGLVTTLSYDPRMRLVSRSVGGETTAYGYDGVGQLVKVTLPDGSFLAYTYDAAHRLTGLSDNLGNRVAYTLDAMGNRKQEQVFDPANSLAQTRSRVFDNLNRLVQEIGAQSQTTTYAYDSQSNVTSVTDPLNRQTVNAYDALNRLVQVTDPSLGATRYGYNGLDKLTSVTDPRSLVTSYAYDGLSNLGQQISPDTGTTQNTYDAAGNLLTQTDAKGQVTAYAYDALNRVTSITFHDGSRQSYAYDQGTNGVGRLSQITELDPTQAVTTQTAYAYDSHGRAVSETKTLAGVGYVTNYQYDAAGRLSGMGYPSGRQVSYVLDARGRISQVWTVTPSGASLLLAWNIAYRPFGGVKSYTLGNGRVYTRGYDQDGRIASYGFSSQPYAIGYDAASRISFIADANNPAIANNYGYDALDRLTSSVIPNNQFAYTYDAVGNRLSKTLGSSTETYAYGAASNRVSSITAQAGASRTFTFDANGLTVDDGLNQYVYDVRGRMVQSTGAIGATAYQVNALGQRVRKTNAGEDRIYHYDREGRLIAESDPGGTVKREYVYLGDVPVAVIQ